MYGHVKTLAEAEVKGIQAAGGTVDLFQYESPARNLNSSLAIRKRRVNAEAVPPPPPL